jgi:glutamate-1-semialdehyde 2,1-aminomutase
MHAVRLARGYTSKNGIVKIRGCFHGSHDTVLVSSGSGSTVPSSEGIPYDSVKHTYEAEFNDAGALENILEKNDDIAAVILEPVMGNMGVIAPESGYLEKVRKMTSEHVTVLIFDEVITGSRLSSGGAQGYYGVVPDLCTMGKIIGGGLSAGAVAGKKEIMGMLAPAGKVYQAGTFSGNPLTAAAGTAALLKMNDTSYTKLNRISQELTETMRDALTDRNISGCVQSTGSMFQVFFGIDGAKNAAEAGSADRGMFRRMFEYFLDCGVYLPPSPFEVNFLSVSHGDAISKISEIFDGFLGTVMK